jgi:hypothetical protein
MENQYFLKKKKISLKWKSWKNKSQQIVEQTKTRRFYLNILRQTPYNKQYGRKEDMKPK